MSSANDWWRDALDGAPIRSDADRAYFIETPSDAFTDTQENVPRHRWTRMRRSHYDWLAKALSTAPAGQRVVDIGCGQSQFRDLLAPHAACGIDFYPYAGAKIVADLNMRLPLKDDSCDAAVLSNVLEHIYEPRSLLAETRRILKPDGIMLVVVPFMIKIHQSPYDFFRYTNFALDRLCRDAGFAEVAVEPLGNLFDTFDLERGVRARILRRETDGWRRQAMRGLMWIERKCDAAIHAILPSGVSAGGPDRDGFPHSFAVRAKK
jgi:SAM-dependent methyltransferase